MNLNTPKACKTLGLGYFIAMTLIEVVMFCTLYSVFVEHWARFTMLLLSLLLFNGFLWFFATKYDQTLARLNKK